MTGKQTAPAPRCKEWKIYKYRSKDKAQRTGGCGMKVLAGEKGRTKERQLLRHSDIKVVKKQRKGT